MIKKKSEKTIISINIGTNFVSLVKGVKKDGKINVLDFACRKDIPGEKASDLITKDVPELLTSLGYTKQTKNISIHSTISGRKLCIRVIKMPIMPHSELALAIRSKIFKYVSPDVEQVIFRFAVLGETQEKDVKKLEVVFAAIQKNLLDEYLRLFKSINIEPEVITTSCFSDWNLIKEAGLDKGEASLMLVDIENQDTDLTIYKENRFVFTRNIAIGEKDFVDILKSQPQLSIEKAANIELLWIPGESGAAPGGVAADAFNKVKKAMQNEADVLCKEIELTAHHYYQITHGSRIGRCLIFGIGSKMAGLISFLKQRLEIPIEGLDILDNKVELPPERKEEFRKDFPFYSQSLGVLLTGPGDINFAPEAGSSLKKFLPFVKFLSLPNKLAPLAISFAALGLAFILFFKGTNIYYKHQIKSYTLKRDNYNVQALQLLQIRRQVDALDSERNLYFRLIKEYPAYANIITEICKAVSSEKFVLDELNFFRANKGVSSVIKFTATGRMVGEDIDSSGVTGFVSVLERSGYFENLSLAIHKKVSRGEEYTASGGASGSSIEEVGFVIEGFVKTK